MGFNQAGETVVYRVPVGVPYSNRQSATSGTDPYLINCFIERDGEKVFVVKRPGLTSAYTYNGGSAVTAQGLVNYKGLLFAVASNTAYLVTAAVPISSTLGASDWVQTGIDASAPWAARQGAASCVANRRVYMSGGITTGGTPYRDVWSTEDFVTWIQETSNAPWTGRYDHRMLYFNERFYVIGGFNSGELNDVWSSPDAVNWTQETDSAFAQGLSNFGACVFNNGMWVLGGQNVATGSTYQTTYFSVDGATWEEQPGTPAWSARTQVGCLAFGGKMWIIGGATTTAPATAVNSVYSTVDGATWVLETATAFASARTLLQCTVYQDKMWAMGGLDAASAELSDIYSTTDGVTWTLVTNAPGFTVGYRGCLETFPVPSAVSTLTPFSVFHFGGIKTGSGTNSVYYGQLDTNTASQVSITTSRPCW